MIDGGRARKVGNRVTPTDLVVPYTPLPLSRMRLSALTLLVAPVVVENWTDFQRRKQSHQCNTE